MTTLPVALRDAAARHPPVAWQPEKKVPPLHCNCEIAACVALMGKVFLRAQSQFSKAKQPWA